VEEDVIQDPLSIAHVSTSFTTSTKQNLKNLFYQNAETNFRIRELEEKIRHGKKDEGSIRECKACDEKLRA